VDCFVPLLLEGSPGLFEFGVLYANPLFDLLFLGLVAGRRDLVAVE
jgi:hypothetical protein